MKDARVSFERISNFRLAKIPDNIIIIYVQNQPNTGPHIRIVNWSS